LKHSNVTCIIVLWHFIDSWSPVTHLNLNQSSVCHLTHSTSSNVLFIIVLWHIRNPLRFVTHLNKSSVSHLTHSWLIESRDTFESVISVSFDPFVPFKYVMWHIRDSFSPDLLKCVTQLMCDSFTPKDFFKCVKRHICLESRTCLVTHTNTYVSCISVCRLTHLCLIHKLRIYRVAKTHRIPYLYRSFSAKVTYI